MMLCQIHFLLKYSNWGFAEYRRIVHIQLPQTRKLFGDQPLARPRYRWRVLHNNFINSNVYDYRTPIRAAGLKA
ncbi:unnamed protein product [Arctogadus glacialis]